MSIGASTILQLFQDFYQRFPFLEIDQAIEYFSLYGGRESEISLNLFEDIALSAEVTFVQHYQETQQLIHPSYLHEAPYANLLTAVARGDGRLSNVFKRARIGEGAGGEIISHLRGLGILTLEPSRQAPIKAHPKHLLKRHLRGYRIEAKVRFVRPFERFWFGFVAPYRAELSMRKGLHFTENFAQHKERAYSLVFEQLSMQLLAHHYQTKDPIISQGSFWDHHSEFDILSVTRSGKIILGECKYTSRKVTKKELTKLKDKADHSGIRVDTYALFSKSGFSKELEGISSDSLLLWSLDELSEALAKP